MHKLMLWMVMLMGTATVIGQETLAQQSATGPTAAANTRRDALDKLRQQLGKLNTVLKTRRQVQQPSRGARPSIRDQDENAARPDALAQLGSRLKELTDDLASRRRKRPESSDDPAPTTSQDEDPKASAYRETIQSLKDRVLAMYGDENQEPGQNEPSPSTSPAASSATQDDTANQGDSDTQAPSASNTTPPTEPSSPRYFYVLGKSLHNQGKDQDALNAFQKIEDSGQLGPFDAQNLHLLKAISHRKLENYTAAAAEYKALLDSLPSNDQLRKTVAWFQQHCAWLARHAKSQQAAQ